MGGKDFCNILHEVFVGSALDSFLAMGPAQDLVEIDYDIGGDVNEASEAIEPIETSETSDVGDAFDVSGEDVHADSSAPSPPSPPSTLSLSSKRSSHAALQAMGQFEDLQRSHHRHSSTKENGSRIRRPRCHLRRLHMSRARMRGDIQPCLTSLGVV